MQKVRKYFSSPKMPFAATMPVIVLLILLHPRALSQNRLGNESSAGAGIGFSWYSPPDGTRFKEQPEKFKSYSGFAFAVHVLLRTPGIWSRLSLGCEYGIHALAGEKTTFVFIVDTGQPAIKNVDAYYFQLLGDVELLRIYFMRLHAALGSGIVSDDESHVLRGGWLGKVRGVFPLFWDDIGQVGMSFTVEVASISSFGGMRLGTVGMLSWSFFSLVKRRAW